MNEIRKKIQVFNKTKKKKGKKNKKGEKEGGKRE